MPSILHRGWTSVGGMPTRTSSAEWQGNLKDGSGTMALASGAYEGPFTFMSRFEQGKGTNPEELIAAAHAGCFTMALSAQLEKVGLKAESLETNATVTLEKRETGWEVTESHLELTARIPGADHQKFEVAANEAKSGCPISRLLNAKITMEARLATTA